MVFLTSSKNGCTYTLGYDNDAVLYYAPLLSDGTYETAFSAYAEVEWEHLEDDAWDEADRCLALLKADIAPDIFKQSSVSFPLDTPLAEEVYGG